MWIVKLLIEIFFKSWVQKQKLRAQNGFKREGLKIYLKSLRGVRSFLILILLITVIFQFLIFGFLLMTGSALYLFPIDPEIRLWILFGLGALFFFIPLLGFSILLSERLWFKFSGAEAMMADLSKEP